MGGEVLGNSRPSFQKGTMNVLSLFDGISCGQLALQRAGIYVDNYYASEIDKYAITITQKNFPRTYQLGNVTNWREWDLPKIDLLIGGSPCQGFSFAGLGLNFDDPRSKLFFEYADILNYIKEYNPDVKFLLENVKMKKEYQNVISEILGVEPVEINSALVSAQNRRRLYWANWKFEQPSDKGIFLKDIIEDGEVDREKSYTIDANYFKGGNPRSYFEDGRRQLVFEHQSHKRAMVRTTGGAIRGRYNEPVSGSMVGRKINSEGKRDDYSKEIKAVQRLEVNPSGKANALTTVHKDSLLVRLGTADDIKGHDYNRRVYSQEGKAPSLAAKSGGNLEPKVAIDEFYYRKLTVLECERLQTVPEGYTEGVSNTQRYKCLGNGWTVDVVAHIFSYLKE